MKISITSPYLWGELFKTTEFNGWLLRYRAFALYLWMRTQSKANKERINREKEKNINGSHFCSPYTITSNKQWKVILKESRII